MDSGEWKYILYNNNDTILIFDLSHVLEKTIVVPAFPLVRFVQDMQFCTKRLFNTDGLYEYLVVGYENNFMQLPFIRIFREDGALIFSCDTCSPNSYSKSSNGQADLQSITTTDNGTKFLISHNGKHEVYTLPGKLPGCSTIKSGVDPP
ncbi:MAG: hypothetical protein ACHQM6_08360, partial [Candidatus Kapaibacterium sp.]